MRIFYLAAAAIAAGLASPAMAEDKTPCAAGLICANNPATVMAAMQKANLAPVLGKDTDGDPMISSDKATYKFDIFFYGCKGGTNCDSMRFQATFEKDPANTVSFANKWNKGKRFLQASIPDSGEFVVAFDVATIGGLNQTNFADVLDWWDSQLGELANFFKAEIPAQKTTK